MKFGLVGKSLNYSFSKDYFQAKFKKENLNFKYQNFELSDISEFPELLDGSIKGLNVTIPYKEEIIPFLSDLSEDARSIGAVNTIKFTENGLVGFNTDWYGFLHSIEPLLKAHHKKALVLGTGGASKGVLYGLNRLKIQNTLVSRSPKANQLSYADAALNLDKFQIIVNTTPLGTFPNTEEKAPLSLENLNSKHLVYDLTYNPVKSKLLREAEEMGATIKNGQEMLELQANKSWMIWNES